MPKSHAELQGFMNRERLAGFATVGFMNKPHIVPVFFTFDDGKVYLQCDRNSVKVRNLMRNPSIAIAVYRDEEAVIIRGDGHIVDGEEFVRRTRDHIDKYKLRLDEQGRDSLGIPLFDQKIRCVIEVNPKRILFW